MTGPEDAYGSFHCRSTRVCRLEARLHGTRGIDRIHEDPEYQAQHRSLVRGAFLRPLRAALEEILKGLDICKTLKIDVLSVWPGSDGADYHFQIDYKESLGWFTEALTTVNKECLKSGVKLGIEPKPYEPRELFMIVPT